MNNLIGLGDTADMNIDILPIRREMYSELAEVDDKSFHREGNLRSIQNLDLLRESFPQGCIVLKEDEKICGYAFSKVLGNVGYIGPIGVNPCDQGKGFAKRLLERCVLELKSAGCHTIGLETMPESGKHIGLYQSAGFELTYPTVTYLCPEILSQSSLDKVVTGRQMDYKMLETFDQRIMNEYDGLSIRPDLLAALRVSPDNVFFYQEQDSLEGVLFYCKDLYRFVYGAFLKSTNNVEHFMTLYSALRRGNLDTKLRVRVNARYKKALQLQSYGFKSEGSMARLTYHGSHGIYETPDADGLILKAWVG